MRAWICYSDALISLHFVFLIVICPFLVLFIYLFAFFNAYLHSWILWMHLYWWVSREVCGKILEEREKAGFFLFFFLEFFYVLL